MNLLNSLTLNASKRGPDSFLNPFTVLSIVTVNWIFERLYQIQVKKFNVESGFLALHKDQPRQGAERVNASKHCTHSTAIQIITRWIFHWFHIKIKQKTKHPSCCDLDSCMHYGSTQPGDMTTDTATNPRRVDDSGSAPNTAQILPCPDHFFLVTGYTPERYRDISSHRTACGACEIR